EAAPGLLPVALVGALPPGRGLPRPGAAAALESRHVHGPQCRRRRARGARRALQDPEHPDARRRRGPPRARLAAEPTRLPRHRELPRPLAPLSPVSPLRRRTTSPPPPSRGRLRLPSAREAAVVDRLRRAPR